MASSMKIKEKICNLCNSKSTNNVEMGDIFIGKEVKVHYFCVLFSPCLFTKDAMDEKPMIEGFAEEDIKKEVNRIRSLKCYICEKYSAGIGCNIKACKKCFHRECGLNNKCQFIFKEPNHIAYCHEHIQVENITVDDTNEKICPVCSEAIQTSHPLERISCKGCTMSFHNKCLMQLAVNAGNSFKCPHCNNDKAFRDYCETVGIFIPDRENVWESEELVTLEEIKCSATNCVLQFGHSSTQSDIFLFCELCGCAPVHLACNKNNPDYTCANCEFDFKFEEDDETKTKLVSALEEVENCGKLLKQAETEKEKICSELKTLQQQNEILFTESVTIKKKNTQLKQENQKLQLQNGTLTAELNIAREKNIQLSQENQRLNGQLQEALNQTFCACKANISDDFVQCANKQCGISWWHYTCAGINSKPQGDWFCPNCSQK